MIHNNLSKLVVMILAMAAQAVALPVQTCSNLPTGSSNEKAYGQICSSLDHLEIDLPNKHYNLSKAYLRETLTRQLQSWSENNQLDFDQKSIVQIFLNVPENNPDAAVFKIVAINNSLENFYFSRPIEGTDSAISNTEINILDKEMYPQSFGYRSQSFLVKKLPSTSERELLIKMQSIGATSVAQEYYDWYKVHMTIFSENDLVAKINFLGPKAFGIENYSMNQIYEWQAERIQVLEFQLETYKLNRSEEI